MRHGSLPAYLRLMDPKRVEVMGMAIVSAKDLNTVLIESALIGTLMFDIFDQLHDAALEIDRLMTKKEKPE